LLLTYNAKVRDDEGIIAFTALQTLHIGIDHLSTNTILNGVTLPVLKLQTISFVV